MFPSFEPLSQASYPATPTLSVDAFHAIVTVVAVVPVMRWFCGTEGACVSGHAEVVICTVPCGEALPAAS